MLTESKPAERTSLYFEKGSLRQKVQIVLISKNTQMLN